MCVCQVEQLEAGTPGRLKVTAKSTETDELFEGEYNTVSVNPALALLLAFFFSPFSFFAVYENLKKSCFCLRY